MPGDIMRRLREAEAYPKTFTRADFDLTATSAGVRERLATVQVKRPHALRADKPLNLAIMAYEEFTTDGTAGNQETFTLSHDLVESGATDTAIIAFEGDSALAVDSYDVANDTVTVTAANASSTVGFFYTAADQARVIVRKRDPQDNDETLFSGDIGLLHNRDTAKEPVTFDFESALQPVIPTDWHLDVYVDAPYQAALEKDVGGDGTPEVATNGLLTIPARQSPENIPGLGRAVMDDRSGR